MTTPLDIFVNINQSPQVGRPIFTLYEVYLTVPTGRSTYDIYCITSPNFYNLPVGLTSGYDVRDSGLVISGTWHLCYTDNHVQAFLDDTNIPYTCVVRRENGSPEEVAHVLFAAFRPNGNGQGQPVPTHIILDVLSRPFIQLFTTGVTPSVEEVP